MKTTILKKINVGMLLILLIPAALASSCVRSEAKPPEEISISWSEIDQEVELEVGDILEVVLPAQPSTGYIWEVGFYNKSVLESYGEAEFSASSSILGGEESQLLHFTAIDEGETDLVLVYRRSFEEEGADQQTWEIFVTVIPKVSDD
jgi:inhibitor of cysteine peptidase